MQSHTMYCTVTTLLYCSTLYCMYFSQYSTVLDSYILLYTYYRETLLSIPDSLIRTYRLVWQSEKNVPHLCVQLHQLLVQQFTHTVHSLVVPALVLPSQMRLHDNCKQPIDQRNGNNLYFLYSTTHIHCLYSGQYTPLHCTPEKRDSGTNSCPTRIHQCTVHYCTHLLCTYSIRTVVLYLAHLVNSESLLPWESKVIKKKTLASSHCWASYCTVESYHAIIMSLTCDRLLNITFFHR